MVREYVIVWVTNVNLARNECAKYAALVRSLMVAECCLGVANSTELILPFFSYRNNPGREIMQ
jgi:hypothetical protein